MAGVQAAYPGILQQLHVVPWVEGNGSRTMALDICSHVLRAVQRLGGLPPLDAVYTSDVVLELMSTRDPGVFTTQAAGNVSCGPTKTDGLMILLTSIAGHAFKWGSQCFSSGISSFVLVGYTAMLGITSAPSVCGSR
jgi:hypothetical protein